MNIDYDAPLSESGELTAKWHKTKEIFQQMLPDQGNIYNIHVLIFM